MTLQSPLARRLPKPAATDDEIVALRRRAFIEQGVATLKVEAIADPWTRQAVVNETRRQLEIERG